MEIRFDYILDDEPEELIIRIKRQHYRTFHSEELKYLTHFFETRHQSFVGTTEYEKVLFHPSDVYYFEYVERKIFAYMKEQVCEISGTLEKLEESLLGLGFVRCSKSMILNVNCIDRLQSSMGNRILATLANGETVIISRHYAKTLRAYLKGGRISGK